MKRPRLAFLCCALALGPAWGATGRHTRFSFSAVVSEARALAKKPYTPSKPIPQFLRRLTYNEYQSIRFIPTKAIWQNQHARFQVQLISPGLYYTTPIQIFTVSNGVSQPVVFHRADFSYPSPALAKRIPPRLGYAGFKLTYPLVGHHLHNQFLVFAGASYFRAVGRPNRFGLSARGIAINTAFPPHEQFPAFEKFWIIKPAPDARRIQVDALLNGRSLTGAYRFIIRPGNVTRIRVRARLFFRRRPRVLGIAPLTSMFFYGVGTPRPTGEWRPAVHDSDGLEMVNGDGEWIWRPLIDPPSFQVTSFSLDNPRGFGLVQRDERFVNYEDLNDRYDLRPSAWVIPRGAWGHGRLELVEIPTASETVDNIVSYWVPGFKIRPGREYGFAYRLLFGRASIANPPGGAVVHTFVGAGRNPGMPCRTDRHTLRFIVDFTVPRSGLRLPVQGVVSANPPARVTDINVIPAHNIGPSHRSFDRLSFLVRVPPGHALELRAFLKDQAHTLTETWSEMLPADAVPPLTQTPGCP